MQNPFTTSFSKVPKTTYIITDQEKEVLDNFSYPFPERLVRKELLISFCNLAKVIAN